jgi:RNA polymerase sigma-70 factor (ECF subfamily)
MEGRPTEDTELIVRARKGEVMAYEELVRRYQDVAVRTAHLISPDGDAEDAVQDAFVKAYAALARFRLYVAS